MKTRVKPKPKEATMANARGPLGPKSSPVGPKILFFDIETAPTLGYVWGLWEQNVLSVERDWYVLCWAAKWAHEPTVMTSALPDHPLYKRNRENDREVVKALWKLLDEADVVVAQNGDAFDVKKMNARFIQHGIRPPAPYKTVDTFKVVKKYFKFDSNKLADLGKYLKVGEKLQTGGFETWKGCMNGDPEAWQKMVTYNIGDVILLEQVYLKVRPWMTNHPNFNVYAETTHNCPNCGSPNVRRRGFSYTRSATVQRYNCVNCGAWSQGKSQGTGAIR